MDSIYRTWYLKHLAKYFLAEKKPNSVQPFSWVTYRVTSSIRCSLVPSDKPYVKTLCSYSIVTPSRFPDLPSYTRHRIPYRRWYFICLWICLLRAYYVTLRLECTYVSLNSMERVKFHHLDLTSKKLKRGCFKNNWVPIVRQEDNP